MEFIADTFCQPQPSKMQEDWNDGCYITEPGKWTIEPEAQNDCANLVHKHISGLKALQDMINVQSESGNWDFDPYMQGMLNGLLLAKNCFVAGIELHGPPQEWLDKFEIMHNKDTLNQQLLKVCGRWYIDHFGEIVPEDIALQFSHNAVDLINLLRTKDDTIGLEPCMVEQLPKHPEPQCKAADANIPQGGIEVGYSSYSACDTPYYAECDAAIECHGYEG